MKSRCLSRLVSSWILSLCAGTLLPLALPTPALAQNENEQVGFSSTHIFDGGYSGENIDTLNGNLTLTIPIGPTYQVNKNLSYQPKLNYNSKMWEFTDASGTAAGTRLLGQSPFGGGFTLSFGRLYLQRRRHSTIGTISPAEYARQTQAA
jgi:hypothetical protein